MPCARTANGGRRPRIVHEAGRVRGVAYKTAVDGPESVLEAPLVFVSIQAIESARLFLLAQTGDRAL